jgi:hypothetical protein
MTFEEALRAWVATKTDKPIGDQDVVRVEWQEGNSCPSCGYAGYMRVYWNEVGPLGPTNRVCAWSFRDEEMIDLLKELMAVSGTT